MRDTTTWSRIYKKQGEIDLLCLYGWEHFCDGKPNKSVNENATPRKPCPHFKDCEIRKNSLFKENTNDEY